MRSTRHAAGALLAVLGLILSVLSFLAAPNAGASVKDPNPDSYTGNPSCASFGYTFEVKINAQPTEQTYTFGDIEIVIDNVETVNGRLEFDWDSAPDAFSAVLVKQANGGLKYDYNPPATNDQNVQTVSGQNQGGISHVSFCANPTTQPTFGSLLVEKSVDDEDDPQDPELEFTFTVDCTHNGQAVDLNGDAVGTQATITIKDGESDTLAGIPTGASCTVVETVAHGADPISMSVDGDAPIAGNTASGVIIGDTESVVEVLAENTFTEDRCVPSTGNNQCTPCPPGQSPNGQGGCIPPPPPPPPPPPSVTAPALSATIECADGGQLLTITNTGNAAGVVDIVSGGEVLSDDLEIPAGTSVPFLVEVDEDAEYAIEVTGVDTFEGVSDCAEVEAVVVPTEPEPAPAPAPAVAPPVEVEGVVQTRVLPRTGTDNLPLAGLGLGLILLGAGLTLSSRRQLRVL